MDTGRRWLAVGRCIDADPRRAGRDAARQACVGTDAALVIVFCSGQADPAEVLVGIDEIFPGVPLIGCSAQAVIASAGLDGPGVAVTVLGGPGFSVRTGLASAAGGAQREAGAAVGGCLGDLTSDAPHRILMLLTDGALGDQEEILAGAYSVVGASVPLIGGTCGPDPALGHGYQLHGREVATRSGRCTRSSVGWTRRRGRTPTRTSTTGSRAAGRSASGGATARRCATSTWFPGRKGGCAPAVRYPRAA
ncbi:MAG: hypothetical protein AUI14_25775 [Actinobacteria bacterium 13_2_20CM_2_71_6]|nr:MAG: hypothetical protein AUI14_25775 [Actinobacteria bacterium 13_2_20CM_2_71_6]